MITQLATAAALGVMLAVTAPAADAQAPAAKAQAPAAKAKQAPPPQATYPSPEAAAKALYDGVKADDLRAIYAALGPGSGPVIFSGDRVADNALRDDLVASWDRAMKIDRQGDAQAFLLIGPNETPFPFPLVREGNAWRFDAKAGAEEVINRRIGANELAAMQVCLAFVDAQRDYVAVDHNRDGFLEYAQKLVSSPGKRDGLYWPTKAGEPPSPLGPFAVQARSEGYGAKGSTPAGQRAYHGYRAKLLTSQGKDAPGGAYRYIVNGKMIGGFGVVLYPARYGVSGVMTFMCSHSGIVYEKDLGPDTQAVAHAMTTFNPDASWKKSDVRP
jgi:hypothetical protein